MIAEANAPISALGSAISVLPAYATCVWLRTMCGAAPSFNVLTAASCQRGGPVYGWTVPQTVPNHEETVVIAKRKRPKQKLTTKHQEMFAAMLSTITRVGRQAFSDLDPEGKEEAVAEVIASAYIMFVGLVERGREALAYPSVLGMFGVKRVRIGRKAATPQNVLDVSSEYCQLAKGIAVERLDRYDRDDGGWLEVLVESKAAGPAEIAASRIDVGNWMNTLPARDRRIAETLATGETTGNAAREFHVTPGRISQKRREFSDSWQDFQGETCCQ